MDRSATTLKRNPGNGAAAPVMQSENSLLAKLPAGELDAVMQHGERISAEVRQPMFEIGDTIEQVYFPLTGMASLVTVLKDGTSLERMTVGHEGFVGLSLFHGITTHSEKGMCQIEGDFHQMPAAGFRDVLKKAPKLQTLLNRYTQYAFEVLAQSAACNSTHLVEQRCARWLLMTMDAVDKRTFNLTQEFLAQMLAVRRSGVTVAIGALERQGLVSHRYGAVSIEDAEGLAKVSCECYATIRAKERELLS
jgi:CRP-like cAMP-binding protein